MFASVCFYQYTKIKSNAKELLCATVRVQIILGKKTKIKGLKLVKWFIQVFKQVSKRNQIIYNVGTVPRGMLTACILYD